MTLHIRFLASGDLPALARIADATDLFPSDMLEEMTSPGLDPTNPEFWGVAVASDKIVGFAYCAPERMTDGTWNLLAIAVDPETQGSGAGSALIGWIESQLADLQARILLVETADIPEFTDQRQFYRNRNFAQIAAIPDYYEAGVGKVIFLKDLAATASLSNG